jgi:hypothetical protein
MFPQLERAPSRRKSKLEQGLECLGKRMKRGEGDEAADREMIYAGYTYLGQFIDHDLTFDTTPLARAQPHVESIVNHRSPFLDLDQLYGGGPTASPYLYHSDPQDRGKERFLIGKTIGLDGKPGPEDDLPRNSEGIALTGDPRDDENLIVAQLHVAFLKFHNRVIQELKRGRKSELESAGPVGESIFEQARRLVIWHYQYIVLNEFLRYLINEDVFENVNRVDPSRLSVRSGGFSIPIEFSAAAFRFGHAMVRDSYLYTLQHDNVQLLCLLALTGNGSKELARNDGPCSKENPPLRREDVPFNLRSDWAIEWEHFFELGSAALNNARKFSTRLAVGLHYLPPQTVKLFNVPVRPSRDQTTSTQPEPVEKVLALPVRTLLRGARMGLPSGQDIAKVLSIPNAITTQELAEGVDGDVLHSYGFDQDTPLWYYILREAELRGKGMRLGPVGSRIVADVISGALYADPDSYLSLDPTWTPKLPGASQDTINRILEFIAN